MDGKLQSSFIPKKPLTGIQEAAPQTHVSIFSVLAVFLFVISIGLAGGAFFWVTVLEKQKDLNIQTLEDSRKQFDPSLIDELKRVNTRIDVAKELLDRHVSVSNFFDIIEGFTLRSVRFTNFSYVLGSNTEEVIKLQMNGEAESFSAIALQSDVLGKNKSLSNPILSNLALKEGGKISFTLGAEVPASILLYKDFVKGATPAQAATSTTATSTPPAATSTTKSSAPAAPVVPAPKGGEVPL